MKKQLRVIELFAGIGAPRKALIGGGYNYKVIDAIEIDKHAVKSYNAIYNENIEPQDICEYYPKKEELGEIDLLIGGFPCQDISSAGKQKGIIKGETRSGLMYEMMRIIKEVKPKYIITENVKNLLSEKFRPQLEEYLCFLSNNGYKVTMDVLNACEVGTPEPIPQKRKRVFIISTRVEMMEQQEETLYKKCEEVLSKLENEKRIQKLDFKFPHKQDLKLKMKDLLETEVDEKYYLSDKMINYISAAGTTNYKNPDSKINLDIARPITTAQNKRAGTTNYFSQDLPDNYDLTIKSDKDISIIKVGNIYPHKQAGSIYDKEGISPTITTSGSANWNILLNEKPRVRKLTPKECWRLMGFKDEDYEKASKVNSDAQLYKQAGNSMVVNVIEAIYDNLLIDYK